MPIDDDAVNMSNVLLDKQAFYKNLDKIKVYYYFFLQKALTEYAALTRAMCESKFALVVRKVYRKGSTPRLGLLIPEERLNDDGEMKIVRR